MYVVTVTVFVAPGREDEFLEETRLNHEGSVREPGCARFDVLRCLDDPGRFLLYEAYRDEAAAAAHKETAHYLRWRDAVQPWMARPREGVKHRSLWPGDEAF